MDGIIDEVLNHIEKVLFEGFPPDGRDPLEELELFFMRRIRVIRINPYLSRLLLSDYLAQAAGAKRRARIESFKKRSSHFVKDSLTRAKEQNLLDRDCGLEEGAVLVFGAIFALAHSRHPFPEDETLDAFGQRVWSVLYKTLSGCKPCDRKNS